MADIQVRSTKTDEGWSCEVTVSEANSRTQHTVLVSRPAYDSLTAGSVGPEDLVRESFAFLLAREPKESILRSFDLLVIARYFPEYEREMRKRFGA